MSKYFIVVIIAAVVGVILLLPTHNVEGVPSLPSASSDRLWIEALYEGKEVELYRNSVPVLDEKKPFLKLQSLGLLGDDQKRMVREAIGIAPSWQSVLIAQEKAEAAGTVEAYKEFLQSLYVHEKRLAAQALLDRDEYVTLPAFTWIEELPESVVTLAQVGIATLDGQKVDVRYLIDTSEFPEVAVAQEELAKFETLLWEESANLFNAKPYDARREAFEKHDQARAQWLVTQGSERSKFREQMLPRGFGMDRTRYFLIPPGASQTYR